MNKTTPYLLFMTLVLLVTLSFFMLIKDFLLACFWSIILAVVFDPMYQKIRQYNKNSENMALALTMLIIILFFVIPLFLLIMMIAQEAAEYYSQIEKGTIKPALYLKNTLDLLPKLPDVLGINIIDQLSNSAGNVVSQASKYIAQQAPTVTQNLFNLLVQIALTFYVLYFMLRDGRYLIRKFISQVPIGDSIETKLFERFTVVARAAVKGGLIVAVIQGSIGGFVFWCVGIPVAFLWGALMIILSLLPVGSALVWVPASLILFLQGETAKAVIIVAAGVLFIGLIDNFLRPYLIDKDSKMPNYLVLISTLGGLTWFSLTGFVLGPIIAALFVTCWEILGKIDYSPESLQK